MCLSGGTSVPGFCAACQGPSGTVWKEDPDDSTCFSSVDGAQVVECARVCVRVCVLYVCLCVCF